MAGIAAGAVLALLVVLLMPLLAPADSPNDQLPNLVSDRPTNPYLSVANVGGRNQLLVRFNGYVHNAGNAALEVRGSDPSNRVMRTAVQRVYQRGGGYVDDASGNIQLQFESNDQHNHWHFMHAARYSLWNEARTAEVAPAMKVGFCLLDSQRMAGSVPSRYTGDSFCQAGNPTASSVFEGVSAGWRDVYTSSLAFQWVDVSDVAPGVYWLRSQIDPDNVIRETSEADNTAAYADKSTTIPGYLATAIDAGSVAQDAPKQIALASTSFEDSSQSLGSARYRITSIPSHGKLDVASGSAFSDPTVTYTPDPGYSGPDSFRYSAEDSRSDFPRTPAQASVSISVDAPQAPSVAISGAPARLVAGTSAQLSATVTGAPAGVTWSVDGIPGGDAQHGTISDAGLYAAPATPPAAGAVTIRAASANASGEVAIAIDPVPTPLPAPSPTTGNAATPGGTPAGGDGTAGLKPGARARNPLGRPALGQFGSALVIRTVSARAGLVRVVARRNGKAIGACGSRLPAGVAFTCHLALRRGTSPRGVTVSISLRVRHHLVAVRHGRYARPKGKASTNGVVSWVCVLTGTRTKS